MVCTLICVSISGLGNNHTQTNTGKNMKNIIPIIALIILSGCVSTKNIPLNQNNISKMDPSSILVTKRAKPDFTAMTAGKAGFGLLGAAAMVSSGNKIVKNNSIEDPAAYIGANLSAELTSKYGLKVNELNTLIKSRKAKEISKRYLKSNSDWILDIETINWSFGYFPSDWNNYRVIYTAKLRLIDSRDNSIVAEGFCSRVPKKDSSAPSHDELLDQNAARIKSELLAAADHCIKEFKTKVLKI